MKTITILLFSILLNSCGATKDNTNTLAQDMSQDMTKQAIHGNFTVASLDGQLASEQKLTLVFDKDTNRVSGFSGCNTFSGTYTVTGDQLSFGPLASTKMMCQDVANTTERTFLKTLSNTTNYTITEDTIVLLNNTKQLLSAAKTSEAKTAQKQGKIISFRYASATRGSYTLIEIDHKAITSQFNRSETPNVKACNKTDWSTLQTLTDSIDVKTLNTLEPPSKAHQYDGAAAASLTITMDGTEYSTPSFDDGNPPNAIAELVNTLFTLAKPTTQKQD
ncbi:META domain-containing protein [Olleya sp. Bg11-27]|uniref:META domain-containing protein n=1 Tax=Olleya sp. Bg11-27 TaxID=2058135 RepID=UPI000C3091E0|nr:META domain-containing protein [Olleya sp. Bg11-27]AUC74882.1 hypothetical protein CW732_03995 [Olleya sp. Bg11-27]